MSEVKFVITEATGEVNPKDWLVQTKTGKLIIPLAGGEYRRMIHNGATPVHLHVVNGETIEGWAEQPFYHNRLNIVDRYFDTHRPYKESNEIVEIVGTTDSRNYGEIPSISKWDRAHFVDLHNKGKVSCVYTMSTSHSLEVKLRFIERPTELQVITIQGYRVIGNSDDIEGRGSSIDIAYTTNELTAKKIAKGRGVMGRDASVQPFSKVYKLYGTFEEFEEDRKKTIKASALNKLTDEEKKALGL